MKRIHLYRMCIPACLWLFAACTTDDLRVDLPGKQGEAELHLKGTYSATGLSTPLYLFRRTAGSAEEYVFDSSFGTVVDGQKLKLPIADLKAYDYRFLMVAQSADGALLSLADKAGMPLAPGTVWSDLRLLCPTGMATAEGYCGFTDCSGKALLDSGTVLLTLDRIAGQMRFDCFRIGESLAEPVGVVSPDVESVLDRIVRIEITYDNPTVALRFDAGNRLVASLVATEPLVQTVLPELADYKVALPQPDKGLGEYDASLRGSLSMMGACLLPSDTGLRVTMVFTYYDTTPACGNIDKGAHTADCFPLRQVTLRLPATDLSEGLPVAADCYTVNRIGLRCDRIIDVPVGGAIETDLGWQ